MTCPHCDHPWSLHEPHYNPRCTGTTTGTTVCGCMWPETKPPKALTPPSPREQLIARVRDAIFDELDRQHEACEIDAAGYWDREWGCLDGEPDWKAVADAAIRAVADESER